MPFKKNNALFLIAFIATSLITSCGNQTTNNDSLSEIKYTPKKIDNLSKDIKKDESKNEKIEIIKLVPLKEKSEITNSIKIGRVDPFLSINSDANNFKETLKLNGFISISNEKYAVVNFLGKTGTINIESVGGFNTKLIPDGALVKEINPEKELIILSMNEEKLIFHINRY